MSDQTASAEHDEGVRRVMELMAECSTFWDRRRVWDGHLSTFPPPEEVSVEPAVVGGATVEWLVPPGAPARAIQWFHGGGYVAGSVITHRNFTARLAQASSSRVMNMGYRLAPEHRFPGAFDDAFNAYRALLDSGLDGSQLIVGGDSAGGGLALSMLARVRDEGLPLPSAVMLIAPLVDVTTYGVDVDPEDDMFVDRDGVREGYTEIDEYLNGVDHRDPRVSPFFGDISGLPPMLLQVSASEALYSQALVFADRLREAGGSIELDVWEGLMHCWQVLIPDCPEAPAAIGRLADFATRHLDAATTPGRGS